jgi:DnaJ domain
MKFDSPLFDKIRVKPGDDRRAKAPDAPCCEWKGCKEAGTHRAPKGRDTENQHYRFCINHVREYNASYNYFKGMTADDVSKYQKDSLTGHRPTWKMGTGNAPGGTDFNATDPMNLFREFNGGAGWRKKAEPVAPKRTIRNAERKAFEALGLEVSAEAVEIKARFKELVKRHHPDVNGGDRVYEEKLREIITAYNYLKSVKLC